MLAQMRKSLNEVLRDVVTLEVALSRKTEAHVLVRQAALLTQFGSTRAHRNARRPCFCRSTGRASFAAARWRTYARLAWARSRECRRTENFTRHSAAQLASSEPVRVVQTQTLQGAPTL